MSLAEQFGRPDVDAFASEITGPELNMWINYHDMCSKINPRSFGDSIRGALVHRQSSYLVDCFIEFRKWLTYKLAAIQLMINRAFGGKAQYGDFLPDDLYIDWIEQRIQHQKQTGLNLPKINP
jgi:hypothetical protein